MNQMTNCTKFCENLTKKFFESNDGARAACNVRSQNIGSCEHPKGIVGLRNKVLLLVNRIQQLSVKRVPNYPSAVSNGPSLSYRDAIFKGNEFRHQVCAINGPVNLGKRSPDCRTGVPNVPTAEGHGGQNPRSRSHSAYKAVDENHTLLEEKAKNCTLIRN